tara:strand:- start:773 stop:880 length:108 start_codon:yes stop_codon:yes gene_type:complete
VEPRFSFVDSSAVAWEKLLGVSGVEIKKLLGPMAR